MNIKHPLSPSHDPDRQLMEELRRQKYPLRVGRIKKLLQYANVNARYEEGYTPLMLAAKTSLYQVVSLLLKAGADPLLVNDAGKTAADIAWATNHISMGMMLRDLEKQLRRAHSEKMCDAGLPLEKEVIPLRPVRPKHSGHGRHP